MTQLCYANAFFKTVISPSRVVHLSNPNLATRVCD